MTDNERSIVRELMAQGFGYKKISTLTGLPLNSVKAYCRRHSSDRTEVQPADGYCRSCGKPITYTPGRKQKVFCSDVCRMKWWNAHQGEVDRRAWYSLTCAFCGSPFESYGHRERKYCSRSCASKARVKKEVDRDGS